MSVADALIALGVGLVAGGYAGLLGVGGGIVMVPALALLLGQDQHVAQGTSLLVIIATAIAGTRANARRGLLDVRLAAWIGAGGAAGAVAGSLLALQVLSAAWLQRALGVLLLIVGVRLLLRPGSPDEPSVER